MQCGNGTSLLYFPNLSSVRSESKTLWHFRCLTLNQNMPLRWLAVCIPVCCGAGTHYAGHTQWTLSTTVSYQAFCAHCWLTLGCAVTLDAHCERSKPASPVLCEHTCHHVHGIPVRNRNPRLKVNERGHACVKLSYFCPCFETAYTKKSAVPTLYTLECLEYSPSHHCWGATCGLGWQAHRKMLLPAEKCQTC